MTSSHEDLLARAAALVSAYSAAGQRVVTAESCTGGLISAYLTAIPGSSAVLDRAYVTYSNEAKVEMIGVPADLIAAHGAVSAEVARAMAEGALAASRADVAVAVTGIAGPGGGSEAKPVGLVHFGAAAELGRTDRAHRFGALDRDEIRRRSVSVAFDLLEDALQTGLAIPGRP